MQIRFPRKIRLGFRPVYGLTVRQLLYVAGFGTVGGLLILAGPLHGTDMLVRAGVGLTMVVIGLTLAFMRVRGLALDEWLPIGLRYLARPRKRVWRKRDVARPNSQEQATPATPRVRPTPRPRTRPVALPREPVVPVVKPHSAAATIVVVDLFLLIAFAVMTVLMQRGGLHDVQLALAPYLTR